jgi:predicted LPLAT superfamily acyltransferase
VTVKLPLVVAVQDSVDAPELVTMVGDRVQEMPLAGMIVDVKLIVPANPLTEVIVIVDVPA